ncbi:hypothetical protein NBO_11g0015 [Nosema bombycis CQ1]|uniref:Uncharacterized protein n=1 Tax=Nosema bombycis (strain CQ1 / CVCC 102059) TaxID=578461 RepID=R0KXL2_NOSB1|nr:hypothetical protein NBO_11g0015 [Nosema bombycis CQ1]|eukprot:EOB14942.1 hypothetical protein NBO_11g0015 [Nosema bombycis CQ1]
MAYLLEKSGTNRCTLEATKREQFTQKLFSDLINESHSKQHDYYLARVHNSNVNIYDARQLCKYVFEMVISTEGRKIRIKNFKDPITQEEIKEVQFFRLKYDTDAPLKAEYVGNQDTFLISNCFRSRVFCSEDALDALSVNFQFNPIKEPKFKDKKRIIGIFIMSVFLMLFLTSIVILIDKGSGGINKGKGSHKRLGKELGKDKGGHKDNIGKDLYLHKKY